MSESETTCDSKWKVIREDEAGKRGAHWKKVAFALEFLARTGLRVNFYFYFQPTLNGTEKISSPESEEHSEKKDVGADENDDENHAEESGEELEELEDEEDEEEDEEELLSNTDSDDDTADLLNQSLKVSYQLFRRFD